VCGIAGFRGERAPALLRDMTSTLRHRGPDDEGYSEDDQLSLGFRRLSIIDIAGGHQPMHSADGSLSLVYNGEVYNYRELRAELLGLGHRFATDCDSEVILRAYEAWGVDAFPRLNGMWAFAIADRASGRLVLCRDHFGIKPLYYAQAGGRLLFASEIKALLRSPDLAPSVDDQSLYEYLAFGLHDHRPETFFAGIRRLPAAHYAVVDAGGVRLEPYWQPRLRRDGDTDPGRFAAAFRTSVARRLVADVPVGACLSGGLDSSTIVSLMSELLREEVPDAASLRGRVKTFSAVFDGDPIDESEYIAAAVKQSGADTDYIRPDSRTFVSDLGRLVWAQDEPFVSTGPYAQFTVMEEAARHVTVVLDGQGGDELMAGYVPYQLVYLRQLLKERKFDTFAREAWAARDVLMPLIRSSRRDARRPFPGRRLLDTAWTARRQPPTDMRPADNLKARLLMDVTTYSLPALLRYEDRNSMAHSLESRVPWLDQELVERILALPERAIIRDGWARILLREGMRGRLPEMIRLRRWKVGFTTPETRWLFARRAVFQGLFQSPAFQARPYWHGAQVAEAFRDAAQGRTSSSLFLWRAINTELWLRTFFSQSLAGRGEPPLDVFESGDRLVAEALGGAAAEAFARLSPHPGRQLFHAAGEEIWLRAPRRSALVSGGDDLLSIVSESLGGRPEPGDIVAISEKIVAISQGRSFAVADVRPRPLARLLSRFVRHTPAGIGLGIPETMELALEEAGGPRILMAAAVAAVARVFGQKGVFYRLVPPAVAAIDGPTGGTIPPYNTHAKLGPADPDGVAASLSSALGAGVAIVDANDLGVNILGHSSGVDPALVRHLFLDNPLGQGHEQTPVALLRRVGTMAEFRRGMARAALQPALD
jgi:asparagine synthase (glutamine-hydrolysing)